MTDFSKKSETIKYFNSIMQDLQQSKIKAIFSIAPMSWNHHRGYRTYSTDTEVYILLENEFCLVIDYRFIDALDIQFRKLTSLEEDAYCKLREKDFFNTVNDIHDFRTNKIYRTETCNLEYSSIADVSLCSVTNDYSKWLEDGIDFVAPTDETFDEIKFTMSNGKSFIICADDAEVDGYTLFWSENTDEAITER
jgi:hypothetical protein